MSEQHSHPAVRRIALLAGATLAALACGLALAQKIDDVPPAVKNNVAPNFMFMVDKSGSMLNIVPASPYSASGTYTTSCSGSALIPSGSSIDLYVVSGAPRIRYNNTSYRHTSVTSGSGTQRCFSNTGTYSAQLLADSSSGSTNSPSSSYTPSDYSGHFLNWYFGSYDGPVTGWSDRKLLTSGTVQTRIEIARTSAKSAIDMLPLPPSAGASAAVRVGLATYGSDGGALKVAMGDLTSSSRTTIKNSIDTLSASGYTPLATTFADIARYMSTGHNGTVTTAIHPSVNIDTLLKLDGTDNSPARNACLSGAPSCTSTSSAKPIQYWCQRTALFAVTDGRPNQDRGFNNNTYVRDYDGDCSGSNSASCVSSGAAGSWDRKTARTYEQYGSDYMDDVAKLMYDVDWRPDLTKPTPAPGATAAKNNISTYMIGFADPAVQNDPLLINTAEQGGGRFITATDGPSLQAAFQQVIADALAKDAAAAAVAVTNAQITAGGVGYASSYNSGSWYGDLEAYSLDISTGLRSGPVQWSLRDKLNTQTATSRKIASWSGTAGVAFTTANGANFRTATSGLTDGIIDYTRGVRTGEDTTYRARSYLLGDIINAEPVVVNYASGAVVYQAANDGMLHAVDGRVEASATTRGQELWAYVPRLAHSRLINRSSLSFTHEYIVDGTPATAEVTGVGSVGRILVGGLGKGGAGYYALDITSGTAANETVAANKALWEFKPTNMGYSFGTPLIVNTAAGWRVVVASGLRNDTASGGLGGDGRGHVWMINPANGNIDKEFITPSGYGSSSASLGLAYLGKQANIAADAVVRYVYAGDLLGNIWRFDLNASNSSAPVRVAALTSPTGVAQPVTSPPIVNPVSGSSTKFWVYVGTGQYYSSDDVPGTSSPNTYATQVETLYGITDDTQFAAPAVLTNLRGTNGASCPSDGGDGMLVCQSTTVSGTTYTATQHSVDLGTKRGFYMDIPVTNGRVTTEGALSTRGTLVFVVNKPSYQTCNPGGTSYLFQLDSTSGGGVLRTIGGNTYYAVGDLLADALSSRPVLIITSTGTRGLLRLSDKTTQSREVYEPKPPTTPPGGGGSPVTFKRVYKRALN